MTAVRMESGEDGETRARDTRNRLPTLANQAAEMLDASLREGLNKLGGCSVLSDVPVATWSAPAVTRGRAPVTAPPQLAGVAPHADATLAVSIDRFGSRTQFFREVWLRAVAYVIVAGNQEVRGPVYVVGLGRSSPRIVRPGFMRSDEDVVREAVADASQKLVRALDRGDAPLFAAEVRVAVIPARTPQHAERRIAEGGGGDRVAVPILHRQSDVLFQPDVGPVAVLLPAGAVRDALQSQNTAVEQLWDGLRPQMDKLVDICNRLEVDYVFLSAVRSAWIGGFTAEDGSQSVGDVAETLVKAVLVDVGEGRVLWSTERPGSARSHIVTPEGPRRIRNDEQCILDAALSAYASVRVALEEWMRHRKN